MLDSVQSILDEYADLETRLAAPEIHTDQDAVRTLNKRYAALAPTVAAARAWRTAGDDLDTARELAVDDEGFAADGAGSRGGSRRCRGAPAPDADPA